MRRRLSRTVPVFLALTLLAASSAGCRAARAPSEEPVPPETGTFRISPVAPIDELRAAALVASPPLEEGEFLASDLVDITEVDPTIRLEIRYATTDNFMGAVFYDEARAFLQRPAAEALARAADALAADGYGLLVFDAYRPWFVTKMFWDATPEDQKIFVADPADGSRHNRGCAVDLTLYELSTGATVDMPSGYDEFTERAYADHEGGTALEREHRALLRSALEAEGFDVYPYEWWHFDFADWRSYPILNRTFDEID